jgi:hypothetical protein
MLFVTPCIVLSTSLIYTYTICCATFFAWAFFRIHNNAFAASCLFEFRGYIPYLNRFKVFSVRSIHDTFDKS